MKTKLKALLTVSAIAAKAFAEPFIPGSAAEDKNNVMSDKYWEIWNPQVQEQIDRDIEANRKADASVKLYGADEKTQVQIEQISHDFIFGAHIFNFNQLETNPQRRVPLALRQPVQLGDGRFTGNTLKCSKAGPGLLRILGF
ncbi:MAG: hypothetical protein ACLUKN_14935 [Bacilli bacterium]